MQIFNTQEKYGLVAITIHWVMALLIIGMLAIGLIMTNMEGDLKRTFYDLHKSFGVLIFGLFLIRIIWKFTNPTPPPPEGIKTLEKIISKSVVGILYLGMIMLPVSGYMMSATKGFPVAFFGIELPMLVEKNEDMNTIARNIHTYMSYILIGFISLHTLAALKHHFILKNNLLTRMLPGKA